MDCPVATGGCAVGRLALWPVPPADAHPARVSCDIFKRLWLRKKRGPAGGSGADGVEVGACRARPSCSSRLHPRSSAPGGSTRAQRVRTVVSGSGSLLITRRLWGNAPRRNSHRQSRPFCRLQSPPPRVHAVLWYARTSLNLASLLELSAACRPLPRFMSCCTLRHPRGRGRGRTSGYFISIAVHYCGPVSATPFCEPHNLSLSQSAWLPVSPELLIPAAPAPRAFRSSSCPSAPSHSFPAIRARVAMMPTVSISVLVLVVRQSRHVGRWVAQYPSAARLCLVLSCLVTPARRLTAKPSHHAREEDGSREGCQAERGPGCDALGHPFLASRPGTRVPSRAGCQLAYSITVPLACKSHALSRLQGPRQLLLLPPPPQMMEIANHAAYSTPRILAMRGAEDVGILDSSMRAVLDRAQPERDLPFEDHRRDRGTKAALCSAWIIFPSLTGRLPG